MKTVFLGILCLLVCFVSVVHAETIMPEPVIHLEFENNTNNSGTFGASHNGVMFGDASYSADVPEGWDGYSVDMGSNGYVKIPNFVLGNTATIATFIKADFNRPVDILARDGMNTVFSTRSSTSSPSGALLFVNHWNTQNRAIEFETGSGSTYQGMATSPGSVENNAWQHLALTVNRTTDTVEFYVDGTKLTSNGLFMETFSDNRAMFIGAPGTLNWWHFGGKIDDFRVYDSVLTQSEIRCLVPEPGTLVILAVSSLGMILRKRR